jgi:cell division protein FtsN
MAQTDYVARGQKRKKKAPKKAPTPWLRIIIALTLVCGFVFGLYFLQTSSTEDDSTLEQNGPGQSENSPSSAPVVSNDSDVVVSDPALDRDPLPVLGEEDWAFIDALPEYSVEVDIPEAVDSDKQYIMPCGSFRATSRAEELRAILAMQGLEARIIESNGANGRWYRVVLGPYERKRAAERDRHQLRRANVNTCKIYLTQSDTN